jgi:hypothetical protein
LRREHMPALERNFCSRISVMVELLMEEVCSVGF